MTTVPRKLALRQRFTRLDRMTMLRPTAKTTRHRLDVGVAHLLQRMGRKRRSDATRTINNQCIRGIGCDFADSRFQMTAAQKLRPWDKTVFDLVAVANVHDNDGLLVIDQLGDVLGADFLNSTFDFA